MLIHINVSIESKDVVSALGKALGVGEKYYGCTITVLSPARVPSPTPGELAAWTPVYGGAVVLSLADGRKLLVNDNTVSECLSLLADQCNESFTRMSASEFDEDAEFDEDDAVNMWECLLECTVPHLA